jgi:hypothetical protein
MSKSSALVVGVFLLSAWPLDAGERLKMRVSPAVSFAPATVMVRATIEANRENRAIQIVVESAEFYRSSEIQLDGDRAPRTTVVEFRSLPGGAYEVTAVLIRVNDRSTASQQLNVVGRGTAE